MNDDETTPGEGDAWIPLYPDAMDFMPSAKAVEPNPDDFQRCISVDEILPGSLIRLIGQNGYPVAVYPVQDKTDLDFRIIKGKADRVTGFVTAGMAAGECIVHWKNGASVTTRDLDFDMMFRACTRRFGAPISVKHLERI